MATDYPGAIDSFAAAPASLAGPPTHESMHEDVQDAVTAIESTLGTNPHGDYSDVAERLDALPVGKVAIASYASDQTGIGSAFTDLTSLSVSVDVVAGRLYLVFGSTFVQQKTASGLVALAVTIAGTPLYLADTTLPANDYRQMSGWAPYSGSAGATTFKLQLRSNAGTVDALHSQLPGRLLVLEVGPT